MITSAETYFNIGPNGTFTITLSIPVEEFDVLTDSELSEKACKEVDRYIKSERTRQERF